jgi:hypothetical protein
MASFAFIRGAVPRVMATGAGAGMHQALGVAVFSGTPGVALFGVFPDASVLPRHPPVGRTARAGDPAQRGLGALS